VFFFFFVVRARRDGEAMDIYFCKKRESFEGLNIYQFFLSYD